MAKAQRELYGITSFFRLIYAGQTYYVREPEGWEKINIRLQREKELYGFNYEFVDPQVTLTFNLGKDGGGTLIDGVYNLAGQDGEVIFEYGYIQGGEKLVQFTGRLNLNTRKRVTYGIEVQIEKRHFNNLLFSRYETKTDLSATKDLNGNTAPACPALKLHLHSKRMIKNSRAESLAQDEQPEATLEPNNSHKCYIQPEASSAKKSELEEMQSMPGAVLADVPHSDERFQFIAKEAGPATIRFATTEYKVKMISIGVQNTGFSFTPPIRTYSVTPRILITRGSEIIANHIGGAVTVSVNSREVTHTHAFDFSYSHDLQIDDEVYCYVDLFISVAPTKVTLLYWNGYIEITQDTVAPASTCTAYRFYDALTNCIHKVTGIPDAVVSDFFGPGGCGEKYAITNGFKLRNFAEEKPVKASVKELIEGAAPIWNLGVQYTRDAQGNQRIRIEPAAYFFGSKRIMDFDVIESYEDQHDKDVTYNEVEIGYSKFSEAEINTLDDFSTLQQWLLPVTSYKAKYVQKSNFIASGYLIETSRRNQFAKTPSTSMGTDDDLFIIAYRGTAPDVFAERNERFQLVEGVISPESAYNLPIWPALMLYNHSGQLNICLNRKPGTDTITNTETKSNGALRLQYHNDEPCKLLAENYIVQAKQPIPISDFNGRAAFHIPMTATFKAPLNYDSFLFLKERLLGETGTDTDYGTIGYRDNEGVWHHGYVWELQYDPINKKVSFTVKVKGRIV